MKQLPRVRGDYTPRSGLVNMCTKMHSGDCISAHIIHQMDSRINPCPHSLGIPSSWNEEGVQKLREKYIILKGKFTYRHCREFVEDVILVSDMEIVEAVRTFYHAGLVVEPSGAAATAALINVTDTSGKKVVVFITGGNIIPSELSKILS